MPPHNQTVAAVCRETGISEASLYTRKKQFRAKGFILEAERSEYCREQLVLHADNGSPMKGATMLATLQRLVEWGIPTLQGLTLTANATAASKQYLSADNSVSVPGRTVFDLGARYATKVSGHPLTLLHGRGVGSDTSPLCAK